MKTCIENERVQECIELEEPNTLINREEEYISLDEYVDKILLPKTEAKNSDFVTERKKEKNRDFVIAESTEGNRYDNWELISAGAVFWFMTMIVMFTIVQKRIILEAINFFK